MLTPQDVFDTIADGTFLDFSNSLLRPVLSRNLDARNAQGEDFLTAAINCHRNCYGQRQGRSHLAPAYLAIIDYLIEKHPTLVNMTNEAGESQLQKAICRSMGRVKKDDPMSFPNSMSFSGARIFDITIIRRLCAAEGFDPNVPNQDGRTALHYVSILCTAEINRKHDIVNLIGKEGTSAINRQGDIIRVLHEKGAIVDAKDKYGKTALHYATNAHVVKALCAIGASVHARDAMGRAPLHYAANVEVVAALCAAGAEVNTPDTEDKTPLRTAATAEVVEALLRLDGIDLTCRDKQNATSLHTAYQQFRQQRSDKARFEVLLTLCQHYAIHQPAIMREVADNPDFLYDLLSFNTQRRHAQTYIIDILNHIQPASERANGRHAEGRTPLHQAVALLRIDVVALILAAGADINATDSRGATSLHQLIAAWVAHMNPPADNKDIKSSLRWTEPPRTGDMHLLLMTYLCQQGIYVDCQDEDGITPLHMTIKHGVDLQVIKLLVEHGADPGIADSRGRTVIHDTAMRLSNCADTAVPIISYSLLALLLLAATDNGICKRRDEGQQTALHVAVLANDVTAARCLVTCCPQLLEIPNENMEIPYQLAQAIATKNHLPMLNYLKEAMETKAEQEKFSVDSAASPTDASLERRSKMVGIAHKIDLVAYRAMTSEQLVNPVFYAHLQRSEERQRDEASYEQRKANQQSATTLLLMGPILLIELLMLMVVKGPRPKVTRVLPMSLLATHPLSSSSTLATEGLAAPPISSTVVSDLISPSLAHTVLPPPREGEAGVLSHSASIASPSA